MSKVSEKSDKKTNKRNKYSQETKNEVLRLLNEQKSPKEIADILGISEHLIKKWKYNNIWSKVNNNVNSINEIVLLKKEIKNLTNLINYLLKKVIK